jgi:hypothetical protein
MTEISLFSPVDAGISAEVGSIHRIAGELALAIAHGAEKSILSSIGFQ